VFSVPVLFWVSLWGAHATRKNLTEQAIKAGVAKYVVNSETGETKFEWIKCEK
jgi:hypothetical protein